MMKHFYKLTKRRVFGLLTVATLTLCANNSSAQVNVTATAGTLSGTYTDLSSAFTAVNAGTHQGAITIDIASSFTDVATAVLNSSGAGSATYTSVLIRPSADGVVMSFASASGRGVIELNGADNVTIDGDNPNTIGTNRDLSIVNTASNTTTYTSVIRIALSTLVTTADNNIVRNCILTGSATGRNTAAATSTTGSEHTTYGILVGGNASTAAVTTAPSAVTSVSTTIGSPITATAFTADNNIIDACARGISVNGSAVSVATNMVISNNLIGSATAGNSTTVYSRGISLQGHTNAMVSGNTVRNMAWFVGTAQNGIALGDVTASGANATIQNNTVAGVNNQNTGTYGAYGINLAGGNNHIVRNNVVYGVTGDMTGGGAFSTTFGLFGIRIGSGTGHSVFYNSVDLSGLRSGTATTSLLAASLAIVGTGQTGCDIRNNILSNTMSGGSASLAYVSLYLPSGGTSAMNLTLNNNMYYSGASSASQGIAQVSTTSSVANLYLASNFAAGATTPTTNLRAYTSTLSAAGTNDNASGASTLAAPYTSTSDLHINMGAGNVTDVDGKAAVIGSITTDFDGNTRNATTPDIGADEFVLAGCTSAAGGTIATDTVTVCQNATVNMSTTGSTTGTGITYQWEISSTGGGAGFSNVTGGTGAATTAYTTAALAPGTYYYRLNVTCSVGPVTGYSNELFVTVIANPVVTVTPSSASFCSPGGMAVALTASGASTFSWSPTAGLSATTGASVNATPSATTSYIVTGTTGSCSSTDTAVIAVSPSVTISDAFATPPSVCTGDTSMLNVSATANVTAAGYIFNTNTGVALDSMAGATTVIFDSNDDTPTAAPAAIGFNFKYEGIDYTQYSVSPDGWILLGGATAVSQFANVITSTTNVPKIYPYWDDVATGTTGYVKTLVTGTAPNRIFIVEWFVTIPRNTTGPANSTFQAWLYETTGKIEFRYGTMGTATMSASVGLTGTTATNFNSVTVATNTASSVTANNGITAQPASGRVYSFETPSLTYLWSPSTFIAGQETMQNPSANGVTTTTEYFVTASFGSCSATDSATITVGAPLTCGAITASAPVCGNTDFTVSLNPTGGGAPYSYVWSDGIGGVYSDTATITANLAAGTYTFDVIVTDACGNSCNTSTTVTVNPEATGTANGPATGETYQPLTYVVSGYPVGSTFQWQSATSAGGPYTNIPGATNDTLIGNVNGAANLFITCIISNGPCSITTNIVSTVVTVDGNDVCDAIALSMGLNGPFTNVGATVQPGEATPPNASCTGQLSWCTAASSTVWFSFVAPASGRISINFAPGNWDSQIALWSADSCGALLAGDGTLLAANDDSTGSSPYNAYIDTICVKPGVTYYVQVDGYGSTTNAAFNLMLNDVGTASPIITTVSQTNVVCNGDTTGAVDVSVAIVSGALSYNSLWDDADSTMTEDISGLAAGTYTLTVRDSLGCYGMATYTITEPAALTPTQNITLCAGTSITVGTNTYTTAGTYVDSLVSVNGCDSVVTSIITVNSPIDATTTTSLSTITANATGATYQWIDCIGGGAIAGATSQSYTAIVDGQYAVVVTQSGCSDTSACVTLTNVGVGELNSISMRIYPNPTNGLFTLELPVQAKISILNMLGETLATQAVTIGKNNIDLSTLSRGTYTVRVEDPATGQVLRIERLIIQR